MKNPMEVLQLKEQELVKIKKEIEALRIAAQLLADEHPVAATPKAAPRQLVEMP